MSNSTDLIQSLQARLQAIEDKEAIRSVLNQYCIRPDNYDFAGYAKLYTEDGTMGFEQWGDMVGHEAIEKACAGEIVYEGLLHMMTNMEISLDGPDTASASARVWFCATPKVKQLERNYAFGGPYEYTFVKREDGWKIKTMKLKKTWSMGTDTEGVFTS
jgi:ketosteroid isomerase-like protein